jgi:hypothetical protein
MIDLEQHPYKHYLNSLVSGLIGFLILFLLIILIKLFDFLSGQNDSFQIDLKDFLLSLIGFGFLFLVKHFEGLTIKKF